MSRADPIVLRGVGNQVPLPPLATLSGRAFCDGRHDYLLLCQKGYDNGNQECCSVRPCSLQVTSRRGRAIYFGPQTSRLPSTRASTNCCGPLLLLLLLLLLVQKLLFMTARHFSRSADDATASFCPSPHVRFVSTPSCPAMPCSLHSSGWSAEEALGLVSYVDGPGQAIASSTMEAGFEPLSREGRRHRLTWPTKKT